METGRKVAVALLKTGKSGARVLLYLRPTGAAVLLRKGDPQFFHSAEKRGLVDAEILRRRQAVEGVAFEGGAEDPGIEDIVSGPHIGTLVHRCAVRRQILGQVSDADVPLVAENEGPLDGVFQFADIPRPIMGHEERQGFRGDSRHGFPLQPVEPGDELLHEKRNVLFPSAQRGKFDARHVHAVVEIGSTVERGDPPFQVDRKDAIGDALQNGMRRGRDDPIPACISLMLDFLSICS